MDYYCVNEVRTLTTFAGLLYAEIQNMHDRPLRTEILRNPLKRVGMHIISFHPFHLNVRNKYGVLKQDYYLCIFHFVYQHPTAVQ